MMNNQSQVSTAEYLSGNAGKYAKLFEIPLGKYGQQVYINTFNMSFRVYWITAYGNYIFRDYSLTLSSTSAIQFKCLTTERKAVAGIPSPVVAHVDATNDVVTVYTTGQTANQIVQMNVLQVNAEHCIRYYQRDQFAEDFSVKVPTYPAIAGALEPSYKFTIFDDFVYQTLTEVNTPWILNKGTDDTALDPAIYSRERGAIRFVTGNTSGAIADDGSQIACYVPVQADSGGLVVETKLRILNSLATVSVNFGLTDVNTLEEPFSISGADITSVASDACCFVFDTDATEQKWFACAVDSDVDDSGNGSTGIAPVADTHQTLRIEVSSDGNIVHFYIDGVIVKTLTNAGISPSVNLYATVCVNTTTTSSRTVEIDYLYISHNR
jgi:hypothetical protein